MISRIVRPAGVRLTTARDVAGMGLAWTVLWLAAWGLVGGIIAWVDPDSIDPGDWEGFVTVIGPMGFLSGVATGILAAWAGRGVAPGAGSIRGAAMWGILGTALVQLAYVGHGDAGLVANMGQALLFTASGGLIAIAWSCLGRWWARWRSPRMLLG